MGARIARDGEDNDVRRGHARYPQTLGQRVMREARAVLDPPEPLFFDGGDEPAVANENGRDIAVIGVQADNNHCVSGAGSAYAPAAFVLARRRDRSGCAPAASAAPTASRSRRANCCSVKSRRTRSAAAAPIRVRNSTSVNNRTIASTSLSLRPASTRIPFISLSMISSAAP